jgi:hypothetical protein
MCRSCFQRNQADSLEDDEKLAAQQTSTDGGAGAEEEHGSAREHWDSSTLLHSERQIEQRSRTATTIGLSSLTSGSTELLTVMLVL